MSELLQDVVDCCVDQEVVVALFLYKVIFLS